ncbi:hypothetical protein EX464_21885 [Vibrio alginolyticus]|nr:hypothetical protein [Vibrio alginolyticus]
MSEHESYFDFHLDFITYLQHCNKHYVEKAGELRDLIENGEFQKALTIVIELSSIKSEVERRFSEQQGYFKAQLLEYVELRNSIKKTKARALQRIKESQLKKKEFRYKSNLTLVAFIACNTMLLLLNDLFYSIAPFVKIGIFLGFNVFCVVLRSNFSTDYKKAANREAELNKILERVSKNLEKVKSEKESFTVLFSEIEDVKNDFLESHDLVALKEELEGEINKEQK